MTIDEQIAVMQAYKEGKTIQFYHKREDEWKDVTNPIWNFGNVDYRIKPEPKHRPYQSAEEVLEDFKKHGPFVYRIKTGDYLLLMKTCEDFVTFDGENYCMEYALKDYTWQDGTPFGKLEEE